MFRKIYGQIKDIVAVLVVVFPLYVIAGFCGITCPIKFLAGISCAGCGMTRAWIAIIRGNIEDAFYYHPMWWSVPIVLFLTLIRNSLTKRVYRIVMCIFVIMFCLVYIYRLFNQNEIVCVEPKQGFFYRLIQLFLEGSI